MAQGSSIRNGLGYVKRALTYRSFSTASLIHRHLRFIVAPLRPDRGRIVIDALGLSLDPQRHAYYLPLLSLVQDLVREGGGIFASDEQGNPEYRVGDLRIAPTNRDDIHVLHETFAKRLYEIVDERDWFALDIGMNVGYVALYFAGILGWETLAYEPFPSTYALAIKNIEDNDLLNLIHPRKAGVGGRSESIEVAFNEEARSTNSLFGNLQADRAAPDDRVEIQILDAAEVVEEALRTAGDRPILVKLDCEGSEYDIIARLDERGLLPRVEAFIIEYHFILPEHTAERIRAPLLQHGYLVKTLWTGLEAEGLFATRTSGLSR